MKKTISILFIFILQHLTLFSQEKSSCKFGNVASSDFSKTIYSVDSNAKAVVLADIGKTEIIGNNDSWFALEFKRFKRIHILNNESLSDVTKIEIPLYHELNNGAEKIYALKAYTYNLVGGKVVKTELDKKNVFVEKKSKNWDVTKFTFPNAKVGSIIEFEYKIESDFLFNLQPWIFQSEYPVLWSEYNLLLPEFFGYLIYKQGEYPFHIQKSEIVNSTYLVRENPAFSSTTTKFDVKSTDYKWVMKDLPGLKYESYTSTLKNHFATLKFQMQEIKKPLTPKDILSNWNIMIRKLLNSSEFGVDVFHKNNWQKDLTSSIDFSEKDSLILAKKIFYTIQSKFKCSEVKDYQLSKSLKDVASDKTGNVADINLLLTNIFHQNGFNVSPVILSTRDHGYANTIYPFMTQYNYVIVRLKIMNNIYYLDASNPNLGFGNLPSMCYNGEGKVINSENKTINFSSDSLFEINSSSQFVLVEENGIINSSYEEEFGKEKSYDIRKVIQENGKDEYLKNLSNSTDNNIIKNIEIDSLKYLENNIHIKYDIENKSNLNKDVIYFNPIFGSSKLAKNPFLSEDRNYPVEFPYIIDETYVCDITLPKNYSISEIPKSMKIILNDNKDGFFEYHITSSENTLILKTHFKINRTFFAINEYSQMRDFFHQIIKKQEENIVFKKIQ